MFAVLDTNVLFASLWRPGASRELVERWRGGRLLCALSPAVLREYRRILSKVPRGRRLLKDLEETLRSPRRTRSVRPRTVPAVIVEDPSDDQFLACAVAAGAGAIVSMDRHLKRVGVYRGIGILTPSAFLRKLDRRPPCGSGGAR